MLKYKKMLFVDKISNILNLKNNKDIYFKYNKYYVLVKNSILGGKYNCTVFTMFGKAINHIDDLYSYEIIKI